MSLGRKIPFALAVALVATLLPMASAAAAQPTAGSLKTTPSEFYVSGQGLLWSGNIGTTGVRTVVLQLESTQGEWRDVGGVTAQTTAAGDFEFWYNAPGMNNDYRVVSGDYMTPTLLTVSLQQELTMWVTGSDRDDPGDIGSVVAGKPFGVSVDTTPFLRNRADTEGLLPIPGRVLTLQRQVAGTGDQWTSVGTSVVEADGMGYFTDVVEATPGTVVYRARQEDWTADHSQIGWQPSFRTIITVSATAGSAVPAMAPPAFATVEDVGPTIPGAPGDTAAQAYGWPRPEYDFAWISGESLTSPPTRGRVLKGWWLDYSDGTGRASHEGGGLMLDSKRDNVPGPGDWGTTMVTLQDQSLSYGRWEVRMEPRIKETVEEDYHVRVELVPYQTQSDQCHTITVADYAVQANVVTFGAKAGKKQWTGSANVGELTDVPVNFAAEVASDHITFYVDGDPVGTVKSKKAASGKPLTVRLSLVGNGDHEMNHTRLTSDWQRSFILEGGTQVKDAAPLTKSKLRKC